MKNYRLWPIAAGLLVLSIVACSSSQTGGRPDSANLTGGPKSDFTGTYKLMLIAGLSNNGMGQSFGHVLTAARAAAKKTNDAGGVNGHSITIEPCDTKGISNQGVACAQKAVSDHVLGVVAAGGDGAWEDTLQRAGIGDIAPVAAAPQLSNSNAFPTWGGDLAYIAGEVSLLTVQEHLESIAVMYPNQPGFGEQLAGLTKIVGASFPDVKLQLVPISLTQADYSSVVLAADKSAGWALAEDIPGIQKFVSTANQLGKHKPTAVPGGLLDDDALKQLGSLGHGLLAPTAFLPPDDDSNKAVAEYNAAMDAMHARGKDDLRNDTGENAYTAVELFAAAVKGLPSVTPTSVRAALEKVHDLDLGLLPPIQFQKAMSLGSITRLFNPDVIYNRVTADGKMVPITGKFVNAFTGEPVQ